jgi:ATP-dependent DNA helicase RecG
MAVIQFCSIPRTRQEITEFTGRSRFYAMSNIVQPLVEQGRLRMTMPDKPQSPFQRFVAVR